MSNHGDSHSDKSEAESRDWLAEARSRFKLPSNFSYPSRVAANNVHQFILDFADAYERAIILLEATQQGWARERNGDKSSTKNDGLIERLRERADYERTHEEMDSPYAQLVSAAADRIEELENECSGDMNGTSPLEGVPTPRMDKALRDPRWPELVVSEGLKLERELAEMRSAIKASCDEDRAEILSRGHGGRPLLALSETELADPERIKAWFYSKPRKPAEHAFTAGPERQIAYMMEEAAPLSATAGAECKDCGFRYLEYKGHIIPCPRCALSATKRIPDDELPDAYQVVAAGERGFLASTVWIRLADAEQDASEWRMNGKETTIIPLYAREATAPEAEGPKS